MGGNVSDFRLRIQRELLDRLEDLAEKRGVSVTTLILEGVRDKLARESWKPGDLRGLRSEIYRQ
jgi:predicted transcriptional regulator